jgi:hypothetical protein
LIECLFLTSPSPVIKLGLKPTAAALRVTGEQTVVFNLTC